MERSVERRYEREGTGQGGENVMGRPKARLTPVHWEKQPRYNKRLLFVAKAATHPGSCRNMMTTIAEWC